MEKMIIIVICLCVMIKCSQSQKPITLFYCTFDDGEIDDCIFDAIASTTGGLQIDAGPELNTSASSPPDQPLSDVTSVFSQTKNGDKCQFPDNINGQNIYFCRKEEGASQYICPTFTTDDQECADGLYAYISSIPSAVSELYESREISHSVTTEPQCLTFYYYFTNMNSNASIDITWQSRPLPDDELSITKVYPQIENKWHKSRTQFDVPYTDYTLRFEFSRTPDVSDTDPFFFAIDNITVITGSCDDNNDTGNASSMAPLSSTSIGPITDDSQNNTAGGTTKPFTISPSNTTTMSSTASKSTSSYSTRSTLSPEEATSEDPTFQNSSTTTLSTVISTSGTTSTTSATGSSTPKPGNFGVNNGLSFGIGILTLLMYFTIIV